ncbi:MAG: S8/S53 family peptidase [Chloroflexota bacterium]|nr:S8/S53 family peptidase [Chloroflexota bacterium]
MHDAHPQARSRVEWYHPGEIVVVTRVSREQAMDESQVSAHVHAAVQRHAQDYLDQDPAATRSFTFHAPEQSKSLVFSIHKLLDGVSPRAVKDAVENLHQQMGSMQTADLEVISALPHVHLRAHEESSGASPSSFPRPVYPDQVPAGWDNRFHQPVNPNLDLARAARNAEPVRVAVLDSMPDLAKARTHAEKVHNQQILQTVNWLEAQGSVGPEYQAENDRLGPHHVGVAAVRRGSEPRPYHMSDHGLFVSGLIHGLAPRARLTLEPVLDNTGVGDLSQLLLGLQLVLGRKNPSDPQIVNLSLGFLPHPARLPAAWYGLRRPHDPKYLHAAELFDPLRNERWVAANRGEVGRTVDLLEAGLRALGRYLSLNNCLVIAAAGNDSMVQVETNKARMEPRLPARFDTVLGVAATTSNPSQPARYSNVGDEQELGDHVATFGGNSSEALEPEDGVIGIYSGQFPDRRENETGYAFWSGTSFATGIVSGLAANFWAVRRKQDPTLDAAGVLTELHAEASAFGPYVPELRTPSIEVRGRWGHFER